MQALVIMLNTVEIDQRMIVFEIYKYILYMCIYEVYYSFAQSSAQWRLQKHRL